MDKINFEKRLLDKTIHYREITKVDGKLSKKFTGAITIELLKKELIKRGFNVSDRDVYIKGSKSEFDLLILKEKERSKENLLYDPDQVVAAFEIKFSGTYSIGDINNIKETFNLLKRINPKIKCVYLTVSELGSRYKYYHEERSLGDFNCYLFERDTDLEKAVKKNNLKCTGDWNKLIKFLNELRE